MERLTATLTNVLIEQRVCGQVWMYAGRCVRARGAVALLGKANQPAHHA